MPLTENECKRSKVAAARPTYRHGNIRHDAVAAAYRIVAKSGHEKLSMRQVASVLGVVHRSLYNHFPDREALLDGVASEAFRKLAGNLRRTSGVSEFVRMYVRFAIRNPRIYNLMTSRPHATMKTKPDLQKAVHGVIAEAMRVLPQQEQNPDIRRRMVMKNFILMHGGISLFTTGILDIPNERALLNQLSEMIATS